MAGYRCLNHVIIPHLSLPGGRTKWKLDDHPPLDFYPTMQQPCRRRVCLLAKDLGLVLFVLVGPSWLSGPPLIHSLCSGTQGSLGPGLSPVILPTSEAGVERQDQLYLWPGSGRKVVSSRKAEYADQAGNGYCAGLLAKTWCSS